MAHENLLHFFSNQVNLYLDNRLNEESSQQLMDIVQKDDECSKLFKTERSFRELIKKNVPRQVVSTDLIQTIKNSVG
jgi:tyrosine-protein phosphatase YwqE